MHKQKPHNKVKCKAWQSERNKAKKVEFFLWIVYEFCGYAWAILNLPTKMQYDFPKPIFVSSRFYSKTKKTRRKRCGIFKCCFKMEKVYPWRLNPNYLPFRGIEWDKIIWKKRSEKLQTWTVENVQWKRNPYAHFGLVYFKHDQSHKPM